MSLTHILNSLYPLTQIERQPAHTVCYKTADQKQAVFLTKQYDKLKQQCGILM